MQFRYITRWLRKWVLPWLVWLSWLGIVPWSKLSPVRFLVRAHAWVAGSVPSQGACKRQLTNVSLSHQCFLPSLSLSFSLSPEIDKVQKEKSFFKKYGYGMIIMLTLRPENFYHVSYVDNNVKIKLIFWICITARILSLEFF